jgi:hypothetical protein
MEVYAKLLARKLLYRKFASCTSIQSSTSEPFLALVVHLLFSRKFDIDVKGERARAPVNEFNQSDGRPK